MLKAGASVAEPGNGAAGWVAAAVRYADEDARTSARLTWWVKVGQKCAHCREQLVEAWAAQHPGVCRPCQRRGRPALQVPEEFTAAQPAATTRPALALVAREPPRGGWEDVMPCSICQAKGHNARGHAAVVARVAEEQPKKAPEERAKTRRSKATGGEHLNDAELLERIKGDREELRRRREEAQTHLRELEAAIEGLRSEA